MLLVVVPLPAPYGAIVAALPSQPTPRAALHFDSRTQAYNTTIGPARAVKAHHCRVHNVSYRSHQFYLYDLSLKCL